MFTDATGQMWPLTIDLPACKRVRDLAGVNLLTLALPAMLQRLADPITLCEVLWAIAKPEADAAGLNQEDFLRRCAVALPPIVDALLTGPGGLSDFFQTLGQPSKATQLRTIWERVRTLETIPAETTATLIDQTLDWMIQRILSASSGPAATNTPASSASTRTSPA